MIKLATSFDKDGWGNLHFLSFNFALPLIVTFCLATLVYLWNYLTSDNFQVLEQYNSSINDHFIYENNTLKQKLIRLGEQKFELLSG